MEYFFVIYFIKKNLWKTILLFLFVGLLWTAKYCVWITGINVYSLRSFFAFIVEHGEAKGLNGSFFDILQSFVFYAKSIKLIKIWNGILSDTNVTFWGFLWAFCREVWDFRFISLKNPFLEDFLQNFPFIL